MRERTIKLRASDQEMEDLQAKATQTGHSLSAYMRLAGMGVDLQEHARAKEMRDLRASLNRIGTNLNQIAKVLNSGRVPELRPVESLFQHAAKKFTELQKELNSQ